MGLHAYRFFFSVALSADEVIEVARSPIHGTIKAGIDHGNVVFECLDASAHLELGSAGCAATLWTASRYAREIIEIIEEAAHGKLILASDLIKGGPVRAKELPIELREISAEGQLRRKVRRNARKLFRAELSSDEIDVVLKIVKLQESHSRATGDMFEEEELTILGTLEDRGIITIWNWSMIELKEGLTNT